MLYSKTLSNLIADVLKVQREDYNEGKTENSGASIDVMVVVHKLASHKRYAGNAKAKELVSEIDHIDADDVLKFAKVLTKASQTAAYHALRKAV